MPLSEYRHGDANNITSSAANTPYKH